jgi:regulator of replication initiation timing
MNEMFQELSFDTPPRGYTPLYNRQWVRPIRHSPIKSNIQSESINSLKDQLNAKDIEIQKLLRKLNELEEVNNILSIELKQTKEALHETKLGVVKVDFPDDEYTSGDDRYELYDEDTDSSDDYIENYDEGNHGYLAFNI